MHIFDTIDETLHATCCHAPPFTVLRIFFLVLSCCSPPCPWAQVFPAFNHRVIVFMWIVLHLQHTTAPLHAWGEAALGVIPQVASPTLAAELSWVFLAMLVYLGFNMFAWRVRSVAPYPVQQRVHDKGPATTAAFYVLNVAVVWMMVLAVRCLRDDSNDFGSSDNYIRGATI